VPKQEEPGQSITRKRRGITVAPSPFNKVKFELGVVLVMLPLAWLVVGRLIAAPLLQFVMLFGLGSVAAAWLVWRTRSILRKLEAEQESGTQQE